MTKAVAAISLDALDARKASEEAFEFEYILVDGTRSGIFLSVLGAHSERVTTETNLLVNDRRRTQSALEAQAATNRQAENFIPIESDVEFGQRLAAVRIVGWRGIAEDYSAERGLWLCQRNPDIAAQVTAKSNNLGNFMKRA